MEKHVYHGSEFSISEPIFGYGKPYNDYGVGFYCTEDEALSKEWAVAPDHDGYSNHYRLEMEGLSLLDLTKPPFGVLNWLAILLDNRIFDLENEDEEEARDYLLAHFLPKGYRDYDIIIGYRADDSYFAFAKDFLSGALTYRRLTKAMELGNLGTQIVLISKKAFDALTFVSSTKVKRSECLKRKMDRDLKAGREYRKERSNPRIKGDINVFDIIDGGFTHGDPRL